VKEADMPWKTADVEAHIKGLSDKQKTVWVKVANASLSRCEGNGGTNCDATAIKQANAIAQNVGESATDLVVIDTDGEVLLAESLTEATKMDGGQPFPASDYAYVPDPNKSSTWKLRLTATPGGGPDPGIVGAAAAALGGGFRGQQVDIPAADLPKVKSKVRAAWRTANPDKHDDEMPDGIKEADGDTELDSDLVPLAEKFRKDGTTPVKIIAPGWGSSGFYSPEVLERDGPQVFRAGTQMFIDHPTNAEESDRPERSLRDLAGLLASDARYQAEGPAGAGLYAEAQVFAPWQPVIQEIAPYIGLSIRALGKVVKGEAEGKKGPIVEKIVAGKSVDFVTAPGAGGKVLQLIESARNSIAEGGRKEERKNMEELQEVTKARDEALARVKELEEAAVPLEAEVKRLREVILLREAADVAREALAKTDLPEVTQVRLAEALGKSPPIKEGHLDKEAFTTAIDEAVKAEVAYLAEVKGTGQIKGMGGNGAGADDRKVLEESWRHMHPDWTDAQIKIAVDGR
jgi:hypothetical protein